MAVARPDIIRTLIIDDEPLVREHTEALLEAHPDIIVVGKGGSVSEGTILLKATEPDLLLLDIQLGDGTGFDLLAGNEQDGCSVIFITAYNDQAIRAIKVGALDYLLKPLDEEELAEALNKVRGAKTHLKPKEQLQLARRHLYDSEATDRIALREQHSVHIVPHKDIIYCEAERSYTRFYLSDGRTLVISGALKDFADVLPEARFFRAHHSYLVNTSYVTRYDKNGILQLTGGAEVPVAVRKRDEVLQYLTGGKNTSVS